jgi:hypothetical protein
MKVSRKKMMGLFLCILMIATIPMVAAVNTKTTIPPGEGTTDMGSTFIRGFITKPKLINGGHYISFRAIFVHYNTHSIGETQSGTLKMLQKLTLDNDFTGFVGSHYIFAKFDGKLDI